MGVTWPPDSVTPLRSHDLSLGIGSFRLCTNPLDYDDSQQSHLQIPDHPSRLYLDDLRL
jgi:hypothetical protein